MPIMAIYRRNDVTAELYDKFRAAAPIDTVPHGALAHAYSRTGETSFVTIDIWEDQAAMERYFREVLAPAAAAVGAAADLPEIMHIDTFITTPGAQAYAVPYTAERQPA